MKYFFFSWLPDSTIALTFGLLLHFGCDRSYLAFPAKRRVRGQNLTFGKLIFLQRGLILSRKFREYIVINLKTY